MTEYKNKSKHISLYLVATPIGNLGDISPRALEILRKVDFIAAEDTRVTGKLLAHFDIKKPMISYYEHNLRERGEIILSRLRNGEVCALVSDAGTPAISDPGEIIVRQCHAENLFVSAIPGPCAFISALAMSGLPTSRFCFEGFLSTAKNSRKNHLLSIKDERRTLVFYEAPHKLKQTLNDLYSHFGDRNVTLVREISKIYEEAIPTTLKKAVEEYENKHILGEFVIIVEGAGETTKNFEIDDELIKTEFENLINQGKTKSEAAKIIAATYNLQRREIYEKFK